MTEQVHDIGRRRAWLIWCVALSVYILAWILDLIGIIFD